MGRKTAIITGANRGVGRGVATAFAELYDSSPHTQW